MTAKGLHASAKFATDLFRTFSPGERPNLIPLGIDELDQTIGGLFPGTLVVVGMDRGTGKSRTALSASLRFGEVHNTPGERAGIISVEDPEDVVGSRLMAWASGVDSLKIRRGDLNDDERARIAEGLDYLQALDERGSAPLFSYDIGAPLDTILESARELCQKGCKVIWLDYLQKIRGHSDDRRNEVGTTMVKFQRVCEQGGAVPVILSQFHRRADDTREPSLTSFKESGDIENEARLALLGWKNFDLGDGAVTMKLAKSTFGGEGLRINRITAESGLLEPLPLEDVGL